MRKDSIVFLRKLLEYRKEIDSNSFEVKYQDFKDIPSIETAIYDILKDLIENNCLTTQSEVTDLEGHISIHLTLDGTTYFDESKLKENNSKFIFNVSGGQVAVANDNGKICANVNNGYRNIPDDIIGSIKKVKSARQKWLKYVAVFLISIVVIIYLRGRYHNTFGSVVYEEGILTPIYYSILMQDIDARDYANQYFEKFWNSGCILNVYVSNKKKTSVTVSETSIVIDDIKKKVEPKVCVIGCYSELDKTLSLYTVNNGMGDFEKGEVCVKVIFSDRKNGAGIDLTKEQILSLFGGSNVIEIDNLRGGEIRKVAEYELNESMLSDWYSLFVECEITEKKDDQLVENDYQHICIISYYEGEISISYGEGDTSDEIVERHLTVDVDTDKGREMRIPGNFIIEGNSEKCILYTIYFTSSCEVTFHARIKCAGKKKEIETEKFTQEIYVPLYKGEDEFFYPIRDFIDKYNIDTYYYNSNPNIQKEIDYISMQSIKE